MPNFDLALYFITDSTGFFEDDFLQIIRRACEGGVTLLQLREKELSGREYYSRALAVKKITDEFSIPLIIDDRVDIALAVGASGVHVGRDDLPVREAKRILGAGKIVGATAKTVEQAIAAEQSGADYLGVGAIFPTTTKVITHITKVETLNEIGDMVKIPIVAIGGLNSANANVLFDSAASGIAVVSAVMKAANPTETVRELKKIVIENFKRGRNK